MVDWSVSRRRIAASFITLALAACLAPGASASTVVTVSDPAGPRVVTDRQVDRMTAILKAAVAPESLDRTTRALALDMLVGPLWREGAAREQGVTFTQAELDAGFARHLREEFPKQSDLQAFLDKTGFSRADVQGFIRDAMFMSALEERVLAPAVASVTDAAIDAYIAEHGPIMEPEHRDFRYIIVKPRAQAVRARAALARGASWPRVARRYADDRKVWRMRDLPEDAYGISLDRAAFRAPRGRPVGPVKGGSGYYVIEVTRIRPAAPLPPKQNRTIIRQRLLREAEERIETPWSAATTATWRTRTTCAPNYVWYPRCGNWNGTPMRELGDFVWLD